MSQVQLPIQFLPVAPGQPIPSMAMNEEGQIFMSQLDGDQIFLRMSPNRGGIWGEPITVTNATSPRAASIAFVGPTLFVAWTSSDASHTLYYTFSDDDGRTFQPVTQVADVVTLDSPVIIGGAFASVIFTQPDGRTGIVTLPQL